MRLTWLLVCCLLGMFWATSGRAGPAVLPDANLSYRIEVRVDPATRDLSGHGKIRWMNPGPSALSSVPMHLYLNAFSHGETTWMRGVPVGRFEQKGFLEKHPDPWGHTQITRLEQGGTGLSFRPIQPDDQNPYDRSLIEVELAAAVAPGEWLELDIEWTAVLPVAIARTGGVEDYFLVAQWFPKLAAFQRAGVRGEEAGGFVRHQFHGTTEFYANFANFDVTVGVPPGWHVAGTGARRHLPEKKDQGLAWTRFEQRAVHDFAWVMSTQLSEQQQTHRPKGSDDDVTIRILLPKDLVSLAPRYFATIRAALDTLGQRVGRYPYPIITVVVPPMSQQRTSGMEYPTFIAAAAVDRLWAEAPLKTVRVPELVAAHEFAHQYFYGLIASNEFEEAFLDEGFTEYWTYEILRAQFGDEATLGTLFGRGIDADHVGRFSLKSHKDTLSQAVSTYPSFLVDAGKVGVQFYRRPATLLRTAAKIHGQPAVDGVFKAYFDEYSFGHPGLADFLRVAGEAGGVELGGLLQEGLTRPRLPNYRVAKSSSRAWSKPAGATHVANKLTLNKAGEHALDDAFLEPDGQVLVLTEDPGYVDAFGTRYPGSMRRDLRRTSRVPKAASEDSQLYDSRVEVRGPGWSHLPVLVKFVFADGVEVIEEWDGRAPFRRYRFVRSSRLEEVRIDPEGRIQTDADLTDDARRREPDSGFAWDHASWVGGLFQWLGSGVLGWL